jgi:hypothetical protein
MKSGREAQGRGFSGISRRRPCKAARSKTAVASERKRTKQFLVDLVEAHL